MGEKKINTGAGSRFRFGKALAADVLPREVWAWAMYDFANSVYNTVVITAIIGSRARVLDGSIPSVWQMWGIAPIPGCKWCQLCCGTHR